MKLPKYSIENPQFTIMVFLLLLVAGLVSFFTMPRTENPSIYIPGASVVVIYPGASPADLEQLVAIPIEEAVNEIEDVKRIETTIRDNFVNISIEFSYGTDSKEKYDDVISKVNDIKGNLPSDILKIQTKRWGSGDVSIFQLAFVSDSAEYWQLEDVAETIKKEVEKVYGIRKVDISAFPKREIRVSLDLEKMNEMNISIDQVAGAIQSTNANIPGGSVEIGSRIFTVKTSGPYSNIDEIKNTVVNSYKGQLIYLKNIAEVYFDYQDQDYIGRVDGKKAVFLTAQQKDDVNIFNIMEKVRPVIEEYKLHPEKNIELIEVFDQSVIVDDRVNGFLNNLLQGIGLVGVIIFLAFGIKSSLIVMMVVPFSFLLGTGVLDYSGFGLQQISIAGLVVALGMLVDNSIVVIDNINRFLRKGYEPKEAAYRATEQIGWPVVSSTVTTVFAFIPIMMMKNDAGEFIKSLPVIIIASLTASLLIALTITPLIASRLLRKPEKETFWLTRLLNRIIEGPYRRIMDSALKKNGFTLFLAGAVLILTFGIFALFGGLSFFPKAELPQFIIRIEMPQGTSLEKTDRAAKYVEGILKEIPGVVHYATNVGHGNPRIYYNTFPRDYDKNFAEFFVRLEEFDVKEFDRMIEDLRNQFDSFTGGKITIKEFEQGTPVLAPVVVNIKGDDADVLRKISADVEKIMEETDGVINIENQLNKTKTDLFININKDKAAYFGVPTHEIEKTIRTSIAGGAVSEFRDKQGNNYDIVLRLPVKGKAEIDEFDKIYIKSLSGRSVPLKQVASVEFRESPGTLVRKDLVKTATVVSDIKKGYTLDEVLAPLTDQLNRYPFPKGYSYELAGELENRQESFGGMLQAIIVALLAIFAVLVLQFKSFRQSLLMFTAIPLGFIGSIWALLITGNTFSFTAFIGLISLVGVVINNAIILVDYINKLIAEGKSLTEAIKAAGETRLTPIMLTSLTTIFGLLPLTIGGGTLWAPMAWVLIGGLTTSTFLTLVIVPVLYYTVSKKA